MYSLYHSLLAQHSKQLSPVRCAPSTIVQLHRYLEDVVLENSLNALVIESLPPETTRSDREIARVRKLAQTAHHLFLVVTAGDALVPALRGRDQQSRKAVVWEKSEVGRVTERFVVIADARFSALLASITSQEKNQDTPSELVVWTFEPDVVYSALEYLMARVTAEHPSNAPGFAEAVGLSMPKATSLQLTLGVTTKLVRLLQEQAEREVAVNRIAAAVRNSLDLEVVLLTAAKEVGRALNVTCCAVRAETKSLGSPITKSYFRTEDNSDASVNADLISDLEAFGVRIANSGKPSIQDGDNSYDTTAHAVVPLVFNGSFAGILMVRSDDSTRVWQENELLLLNTVADQLAVAINQARMYAQMREHALTDSLTGWHNRRSFELQLERDLHLATRMRQPLSLIMMDLDNFKRVNDGSGHETGDQALRMLAETLRAELRAVDTAARYGGDEFAIILPQANSEGALIVAERLRKRIEQTEVAGFGRITASFGLATFPVHASSRDTLVVAADRALYQSKFTGRNSISVPPDDCEDYSDTALRGHDLIESIQRL